MRVFRNSLLCLCLFLSLNSQAFAEGFGMTEWSARGIGLAGGMIGRADDVSALAYNAAGITQLPGIHVMGGMSFIAPYGSINFDDTGHTTKSKLAIWTPVHGYASYQLNDNIWLGLGVFTRFGLGNNYTDEWQGRNNVHGVGLSTVSAVPTIAVKLNDMFSVSLGLEIMYLDMFLNQGVPIDNSWTNMEGSSIGLGFHLGLHAKFNEYISAGISYKSQVAHKVDGEAKFGTQFPSHRLIDSNVTGSINLPDSLAFGVAIKPMENLSFEVGAVWTRWSTFDALDIYFDSGYVSKNPKNWKDGWNFNVSVEYSPLDWLTLRAGYWHETDVTSERYADYLMPTNGRDALSLGVGFKYENWTLDLAYTHIWIYDTKYGDDLAHGVYKGSSSNVGADLYTVSVGYSF